MFFTLCMKCKTGRQKDGTNYEKNGGKNMYINPFFAGVLSTVMIELILLVGFAIYCSKKKK